MKRWIHDHIAKDREEWFIFTVFGLVVLCLLACSGLLFWAAVTHQPFATITISCPAGYHHLNLDNLECSR